MKTLKASVRGKSWVARRWRRVLLIILLVLLVGTIIVQVFYPSDRLVPFSRVDNVTLGGMPKEQAEADLDQAYADAKTALYFDGAEEPYRQATMNELGLTVSNDGRLDQIDYPWYLRLIPTSLLWAYLFQSEPPAMYEVNPDARAAYLQNNFGDPCNAPTTNAAIIVQEGELKLVEGHTGGECEIEQVSAAIEAYAPSLTERRIELGGKATLPQVSNAQATLKMAKIHDNISAAIALSQDEQTFTITRSDVIKWLDFASDSIEYAFNTERASAYVLATVAEAVAIPVDDKGATLRNFVQISESDGKPGRALDVAATVASLQRQVADGTPASITTYEVQPQVVDTYTFASNDEALQEVMKNYATTHDGTYAATLIELSQSGRYASYNGDTQFMTASTYKLFVAYSVLLRIESGQWKWTEAGQGGRTISTCFDDMIKLSDNACAEMFVRRIGYSTLTKEATAVGAKNTIFVNGNIRSTTEDQTMLLGKLYSGRILSDQANRDKWINAMKVNVYRQGIPKGISSGVVADKVGFLDELLHDSAIVYTSKGDYVLSVYTAYASWADIAELTRQLEATRTR